MTNLRNASVHLAGLGGDAGLLHDLQPGDGLQHLPRPAPHLAHPHFSVVVAHRRQAEDDTNKLSN